MLVVSIQHALNGLSAVIRSLPAGLYARPCDALSGASIGAHTRHIVELFQSLLRDYHSGIVAYDNRRRDIEIQTDPQAALRAIAQICEGINRPDKPLELRQAIDGNDVRIASNFRRELLYNLEHCIHHQALIRVALFEYGVRVDEGFGVASSTIAFRKACAP